MLVFPPAILALIWLVILAVRLLFQQLALIRSLRQEIRGRGEA
jgi:hypothetical protein